jgi:D-tyrosyl-tRNA(Tyr) deacylase
MRAVVQRVTSASVTVGGETEAPREVARIGRGLLALVGVERDDGPPDADYIAGKVHDLRVFEDPDDPRARFARSVGEVGGEVLVVSQFTLAGDCRRGRRPAFDAAAPPDAARPLYDALVAALRTTGLPVATGEFRAAMQVSLVNDGPVTLLLDSRKRF